MNPTFDINRFAKLQKRNFFISKKYLIYLALSLSGLLCVLALAEALGLGRFFLVIYPACYAVIVFCPAFFDNKTNRSDSIFEFLLPVSAFERFLIMITNYVIIIPLLCFATIFVTLFILGLIPVDSIKTFTKVLSLDMSFMKYLKLLAAQSFVVVCSMYFKKNILVKTIMTFIGSLFLLQIIAAVVSMIMLKDYMNVQSSDVNFVFSKAMILNQADQSVVRYMKYLFMAFPLGMWLVSFLKLREKEI